MINCFFSIFDDDSKIEIGKECLFSANVIVRNSDSHSILNNEDQRINFSKDVIIGDHVWLAYGVTILTKSVSKRRWTAYFLYSSKDCIIMKFIYDAFCSYYSSNNKLVDYFLIDHIINLGYNKVPIIRAMIDSVPYNNEGVTSYMDSEEFSRYKDTTYIYKLNWRELNIGFLNDL